MFDGSRESSPADQFGALTWPDAEYPLGSDARREDVTCPPAGKWRRFRLDALAMTEDTSTVRIDSPHAFGTPNSWAGLTYFRRDK